MFFRSPFFRFVTHDLEHMMNRSLLRQEMMMRNELQRAMNAFEALEQPAVQRAKAPEALKGKEAEAKPSLAKEAEAPTLKAEKAEVDAMKTKESETQAVKAKEGEGKVSPKEQEMSVQPSRGDPFSLWDNSIDHFFRDVSPFGYRSSVFDSFYPRFNSIGRLAEEMRADMDRHFKTLENPEAKEEYPTLADPENTSYFMRVESNDNGHVKVKTVKKVPGSDWVSKFEEYKAGKALEKDASESKQAIEKKEASQNKERPVEIAEEPLKRDSESASPSASA